MKLIVLLLLFFTSCSIKKEVKSITTCDYSNFYYAIDNTEILENNDDVGLILTFTEYGNSFEDYSYFSLTRMTYDSIKPCLEYNLFFKNSDTLPIIDTQKESITFRSKSFNKHICNNDRLILEVTNKCSKRKNLYYFERMEGEQEYPIHH